MSWYLILDRLEAIWEAQEMVILQIIGVCLTAFVVVSIIAGFLRHREEVKR